MWRLVYEAFSRKTCAGDEISIENPALPTLADGKYHSGNFCSKKTIMPAWLALFCVF